jgi:hypothetical protein
LLFRHESSDPLQHRWSQGLVDGCVLVYQTGSGRLEGMVDPWDDFQLSLRVAGFGQRDADRLEVLACGTCTSRSPISASTGQRTLRQLVRGSPFSMAWTAGDAPIRTLSVPLDANLPTSDLSGSTSESRSAVSAAVRPAWSSVAMAAWYQRWP